MKSVGYFLVVLFVFYLGIGVGNFYRTTDQVYGGYLFKDNWLVYKYKTAIFPYLEHTMTLKIDDYFIRDEFLGESK